MVFIMKLCPQHQAIVARFRSMGEKFFHKVMTKATVTEVVKGPFAYQLEFPLQFLNEHADQFTENAVLEKADNGTKWPLAITVRDFRLDDKKRVFAYGDGGWRDFVKKNNVEVGDLLIFVLVGFSRFRVHIFPKDNRVNDDVHHDESQETAFEESSEESETDESRYEIKCATCGQSPPCPRFAATVIATNVCAKSRLEVSANFWQRHRRMLRGNVILLTGPNNVAMRVKCVEYTRARRARVRLESGWKKFFKANRLRLGDNLLFSLTGPSRFDVEVLD